MTDTLKAVLQHLGPVYLVLDGIDECSEPDELALDLWQLRTYRGLQMLLFSRPNVGFLRRMVPPIQSIVICQDHVKDDLNSYFDRGLAHLQDLRLLPLSIDRQSLIANLQTGASGLFLWARLMLSHLQSPAFSPSRRISIISNLEAPELLEEMYDRILLHLSENPRHERNFARNVFLWIAFGKGPLTPLQLREAMSLGDPALGSERAKGSPEEIQEFESAVVILCGCLVEFRDVCDFIHFSAREYFRSRCSDVEVQIGSRSSKLASFFPPPFEVHTELATVCLSYFVFSVPSGPLSGSLSQPANPVHVDTALPFLRYAGLNWAKHLSLLPNCMIESPSDGFRAKLDSLLRLLERFTSTPVVLMVWVETIYTFASYLQDPSKDICLDIFAHLARWAQTASNFLLRCHVTSYGNLPNEIAKLAQDLQKVGGLWGSTLGNSPVQIWHDVSAFTDSEFFQQSSAISVKHISNPYVRKSQAGTRYLSRISKFDSCSGRFAILTIWPSQ